MMAPPVVVFSKLPDAMPLMAKAVVVALVVVEFPVMTRLPFTVEEADERKPPVRVASEVTERVEESVAAPVTPSVERKVDAPETSRVEAKDEDALEINPWLKYESPVEVAERKSRVTKCEVEDAWSPWVKKIGVVVEFAVAP